MRFFLITMPLVFLTLAPGVELKPVLQHGAGHRRRPAAATTHDGADDERGVLLFVPVLAPMVIYSWLALRWAIAQFQREEVLFREAERLELGLWLKRLLREKEALPTPARRSSVSD